MKVFRYTSFSNKLHTKRNSTQQCNNRSDQHVHERPISPDLTFRNPVRWTAANRALGILIHEMLTGEPPFGYGGGDELMQLIVAGLPGFDSAGDAANEGSEGPRFLPIVR